MVGPVLTEPSARKLIGFLDFQSAASVDIGRTAGAKTVLGYSSTLVHAGSAFTRADPDGVKIVNGTGFVMDSTGATASTDDLNPANLTAELRFNWSDIVATGDWAASEILLRTKYRALEAVCIFDASGAAATTELLGFAVGESTSWAFGAGARVGYVAGAASVGATLQTGSFDAVGGTLANWGLPSLPTACRISITPAGYQLFYGVASGLTPPTTWYGQDARSNLAYSNLSAGTSGCMRHTQVFAFCLGDISGTGLAAVWKAVYLYGVPHPPGHTVTVS